jgi:hypothetical protein
MSSLINASAFWIANATQFHLPHLDNRLDRSIFYMNYVAPYAKCYLEFSNFLVPGTDDSVGETILRNASCLISDDDIRTSRDLYFPITCEGRAKQLYTLKTSRQEKTERLMLVCTFNDAAMDLQKAINEVLKYQDLIREHSLIDMYFPIEANDIPFSIAEFILELKNLFPQAKMNWRINVDVLTLYHRLQAYTVIDCTFDQLIFDNWLYHYFMSHGARLPQFENPVALNLKSRHVLSTYHWAEFYVS